MESWKEINGYFILFAGTTGMLVLCAGMLLFFRAYSRRLLLQQEEKSRMELEYRDNLLYSNIQAAEKERARIARDLHDEVGASLSLLRMQLNTSRVEDNAAAKAVIDNTIDNVRRISYDLLPPALESFGLAAAVQMFCERIRANTDIDAQVTVYSDRIHFAPALELAVYRVLQELVSNTLKYAGASALKMALAYDGQDLQVTYSDNGKSYDPAAQLKAGGLGLKNIDLRIRQQGGTLQYSSLENGCVLVSIRIPAKTTDQ